MKKNLFVIGLVAALTATACSKVVDNGTTSPHPMTLECVDQRGDIWQRQQGITNVWYSLDTWRYRVEGSEATHIYRMLPGETCYIVNENMVL